jgi:iron complex outermembrane receptor protein
LHYAETLDQNYQLFPPGTIFPTGTFPNGVIGDPARDERQMRLSAFTTYSGFRSHSLRLGLGHDDLNMYATSTNKNYLLSPAGAPVPTAFMDYSNIQTHLPPELRKVDYLYAQDEWNIVRDWTLTAGVRHDNYSDFGGTTNPRLALVWDATQDLTAKLLYGAAFRAPSFNEQYGINPVANGNPNLKPETIKTLEEAFSWQARKNTQLNLNFFHWQAESLIQTVANPAPAPGATYQNSGKQYGGGVELEGVWDTSKPSTRPPIKTPATRRTTISTCAAIGALPAAGLPVPRSTGYRIACGQPVTPAPPCRTTPRWISLRAPLSTK